MADYPTPVDARHRILIHKLGLGTVAYCNHMLVRVPVDARWWCQWWEAVESQPGA